jgi:hypothetical protein
MNAQREQIKHSPAQVVALKKIKAPALLGALKHNLREIISTAHEHRHAIDPSKSSNNVILRGAKTSVEAKALHEQLKEKNAIKRLRRDHVAAVEVVVSTPASYSEPLSYFEAAVVFFERFWGQPIVSAVAHFDQPNPHVHIIVATFSQGRCIGSSLVGYRTQIAALARTFHTEVGDPFGFELKAQLNGADRLAISNKLIAQILQDPERALSGHMGHVLRKLLFDGAERLRHVVGP